MTSEKSNQDGTTNPVTSFTRRNFLQNSAGAALAITASSQMLSTSAEAKEPTAGNEEAVLECSPHMSSSNEMNARYERAQTLIQAAHSHLKLALNTTVVPHWIEGSNQFWYVRETKQGKQFRIINAQTKSNRSAFNHKNLAKALAKNSGETLDYQDLAISDVEIRLSPRIVSFKAFETDWVYDDQKKTCNKQESSGDWLVSPDGRMGAYTEDNNLWVRDLKTGKKTALTHDGNKYFSYATSVHSYGPVIDVLWSPDSKRIFTHVRDIQNVQAGLPLVQHVPTDGSLPPILLNPDYKIVESEKQEVRSWTVIAIELATGHIQKADHAPCPITYPHYKNFFPAGRGWWDEDSRHAYFIYQKTDYTETRLMKWDTHTGKTHVLIKENSDIAHSIIPATNITVPGMVLTESNELVWYSDRSGWAHFYLYDLTSGKLENAITNGKWLVRNILNFNAKTRELIIQTAGRIKGRNPYFQDICRVNIDTGKLVPVVSTDHEYVVSNSRDNMFWGMSFSLGMGDGVSPDGGYIATTRSRVDSAPVSLLLDSQGHEVLTIEEADLSGLPANWQWPEPEMLKGADGDTDIYGIVFRPSDFSPDKSYPILDMSFGFSEPAGSFTNSAQGHGHYYSSQAYAELGFVVVRFNHRGETLSRGGAGMRSREFSAFRDTKLPQFNIADSVAAIQQLSKRYPYMDIDRVGIADYFSVPLALTGMLIYPELYKVGVTCNASVANRTSGKHPSLEDFVDQLKGSLFLGHGMLDSVIPVSGTFRIIEALKKANKDFDMLMLPNMGHNPDPYFMRLGWDYLVENLLGVESPESFDLSFTPEV
ncbi:DPP IV N-terminal domain-containing protein [Porticoccaceae bacterium]|nr:DPP IV N-terminal domain-containing protein [Porticoccaceae bacterium]